MVFSRFSCHGKGLRYNNAERCQKQLILLITKSVETLLSLELEDLQTKICTVCSRLRPTNRTLEKCIFRCMNLKRQNCRRHDCFYNHIAHATCVRFTLRHTQNHVGMRMKMNRSSTYSKSRENEHIHVVYMEPTPRN